jgi:hypothetical protein
MLSRKPNFPLLRSVLLGDEPHAIVATVTTSPCSPSPANTTAWVARECWTNVLEAWGTAAVTSSISCSGSQIGPSAATVTGTSPKALAPASRATRRETRSCGVPRARTG